VLHRAWIADVAQGLDNLQSILVNDGQAAA
jgi:hypothetical protein